MARRAGQHDGAQVALLAVIALGGAIGAVARHAASLMLPVASGDWPWATLLVNLTGSALIGVLLVHVTARPGRHRLLRSFLGIGVLGGYTTFSTYAVDAVTLVTEGRPVLALGYLAVTAVGAVLAVAVAVAVTKAFGRTGRGSQ